MTHQLSEFYEVEGSKGVGHVRKMHDPQQKDGPCTTTINRFDWLCAGFDDDPSYVFKKATQGAIFKMAALMSLMKKFLSGRTRLSYF